MNQLMKLNENGKVTSLELVEQINFFRANVDGKSELLHKTMLEIVRDEFEEEILTAEIIAVKYTNSRGREYDMYELTPSQAKQVLVRESKSVRKAVIKYIEELEKALQKPMLPTTYIAALEAFLESEKQKEQLRVEAEQLAVALVEAKPKVEYHDIILSTTDTMTIGQIAEDYGLSAVKLNKILHEHGIQYRDGKTWYLYSTYKGTGLTESETFPYVRVDGTTGSKVHMRWTQKGRLLIHETLTADGYIANYDRERGGERA